MYDKIEFEIQRHMLQRLGIEWTPGEPFYALVEDEIVRLRLAHAQQIEGRIKDVADSDELRVEVERLRAMLAKGRALVEDMDLRMPEQATEDADGWINSYRIPVGPWHRLLGWARGGEGIG